MGQLLNRNDSTLTIWATGCWHVGQDDDNGRKCVEEAISDQRENFPHFDVWLGLGDFFKSGPIVGGSINDAEGQEIVDQIATLDRDVEWLYPLAGNHDSDPSDISGNGYTGFEKWIDPLCENTASSGRSASRQPYPLASGATTERYKFEIGNALFLMMSDVNYGSNPHGRGTSETEGWPAGKVNQATYDWWESEVDASPSDQIVITCAHHMLRLTTVATGDSEGVNRSPPHHGNYGYPTGASYLSYVGSTEGATDFQDHLTANNKATDIWLGAHTHADPDDSYNGRTMIETAYGGTVFCNCSSLSKYKVPDHAIAMSRLLFINGDQLTIRCFLHTNDHAPRGWYGAADRTFTLDTPFHR